ncbi:MAG: hypothetical protein K0R38_3474 [Polyangiaceae bacterium]|jgi:hypothetical protein|nr:hypothetical protein [Polyangiaceae bacterium]
MRCRGTVLTALLALQACSPAPEAEPRSPQPVSSAGGASGASAGPTSSTERAARRSRRGLGCSVKNDCAAGLSCIRGVCEPATFGLAATGKECVQIDCSVTTDCCAGPDPQVPEKCRSRAALCSEKLPGCVAEDCTRSRDCAGGGVCTGRCAVSNGECSGNVDCLANKCVSGTCTLNFTACGSDAECTANSCVGGSCACENPSYSPAHPLCTDPECDDACLWSCEDSRCVIPNACQADDDCFGARPVCVEGACAECGASADCSFDKACVEGGCETPCRNDSHCGLFEACQAGECLYVGCRSHRECALVPDVRALGLSSGIDTRLLRCHTEAGVGRCLVPCQTDSQCAPTEVCSGGLCEYVGCESTEECKTILGLHGEVSSDAEPWIPTVECRLSEAVAP